MKVEVAVLGSPSLIVRTGCKTTFNSNARTPSTHWRKVRAQEFCESRGGHPGRAPRPKSVVLMVSVDVKQH